MLLCLLWLSGDPRARAAAVAATLSGTLALTTAGFLSPLFHMPRPFAEGLAENVLGHVADSSFPGDRLTVHRLSQGKANAKAMAAQFGKIDRQVTQLLERVLDASVPSVIAAYENRIKVLEEEKLLIKERMADTGRPKADFDKTLRTALGFLANPWNFWNTGRLEDRRAVLKLAFADRLRYTRKEGFRTANLSMPFNLLTRICGGENEMARRSG